MVRKTHPTSRWDLAKRCIAQTNKVITTMVIRPLNDPKRCAQSMVADLRPLGFGCVGVWDWLIRYPARGFLLVPH